MQEEARARGFGVRQTRDVIRLGLEQVRGTPALVRAFGHALLHQAVTRRRLLIVVAAFLVCGYAAGVLAYVLATPEIGVRCAFTPVVNRFYGEFLYPEGQQSLRAGDRIVALADQPVEDWSQLLRKLNALREQP